MEVLDLLLRVLKVIKTISEMSKPIRNFVVFVIFIVAVLFSIPDEETYREPTSICWKRFTKSWLGSLSVQVDPSDSTAIIESYATANLLCAREKNKVLRKMMDDLKVAETENQRTFSFRRRHFDLLDSHLAMTGEECFVRFCKIFLNNPKYAFKIGLLMCKSCELCCSVGLNGTWSNESLSCSLSTEVQLPLNATVDDEKESKAVFIIKGENCGNWFKAKEEDIRKNLKPITIHAVYKDDDDCSRKERRCLAVYEASLFCSEEGIAASLSVNVEKEAVDHIRLKEKLADMTNVAHSQIELEIGPKNSTLVLLLLPPKAGLELLSMVRNSDRKRLFLKVLSSTVCSMSDYVSVTVQISALPPSKMFFVPKEATSWFSEDRYCTKFVKNETEDTVKGTCCFFIAEVRSHPFCVL